MKLKTIVLIITFCLSNHFVFSQIQKNVETYKILEAYSDGVDESEQMLENNCKTLFYTIENDGLLYMANICFELDSQSFGPLIKTQKTIHGIYDNKRADFSYYKWKYTNDYDRKSGEANIEFVKIYHVDQIYFILKMEVDSSYEIVFKGRKE